MRPANISDIREVALPWSQGLLSARLWQVGERTVAGVPELGLHCFGKCETEAVFRLFSTLLKYYRQLKANEGQLKAKGKDHLELLSRWIEGIEQKMKASEEIAPVIPLMSRKRN